MNTDSKITTVEAYMAALPQWAVEPVENMRQVIKQTVPQAEELYSYGIIGYKYRGVPLVYIGGYEKHCAVYAVSKEIAASLKTELKGFKINGQTIQFTQAKPLPGHVLTRIVLMRLEKANKAADEREAKKTAKKNKAE